MIYLEETKKEIKIGTAEYEIIHDFEQACENAFFESLFKAYKLGGWPCGWNPQVLKNYMQGGTDGKQGNKSSIHARYNKSLSGI